MLFGTEILTTAQMRAIESAAIASGRVTGAQLMERAGAAAAQVIMQEQPRPGHAMILCGPGNNGGDGFVVARHLHHMGWRIRLGLWGDPLRLPGDARLMHDEWARLGEVASLSQRMIHETRPGPDIIVDAIFGTGLSRPPEGELAAILEDLGDLVRFWKGPQPTVFSLDAPSGLNMDSGRTFVPSMPDTGAAMVPLSHVTVAFHSLKPGHLLDDGPHYCGRTIVVDIGLPHGGSDIRRVDKPCESWLQKSEHHKYRHGHALILAGAAPMAGAARLAARAALRVGAGVVTLCPPSEAVLAGAGLDAVMLRAIDTGADLSNALRDRRINALCLGPGLGRERAAWLLPAALEGDRACVLDADALTAFRDDPARLFAQTHARTVMTPHPGEFHDLFPDLAERFQDDVNFSKVDAARAASARAGCIILLKGPDTVIAAADGKVAIHRADDVPWLATAGSGDVLAGLITGLLARGLKALNAAATGAWLHAAAARRFGPGLIADDLPDQIPGVFRDMGL